MFSGPFNRIIDAVANIAQKLGATVNSTGNRLADNLDGIANVVTPGGGGGSGVLVVNITSDETTHVSVADKTAGEIKSAALSGGVVASFGGAAVMSLVSYAPYGTEGAVCFCFAAGDEEKTQLFASFFYAESDSDYPSTETPK